jgi:hypothetical protein
MTLTVGMVGQIPVRSGHPDDLYDLFAGSLSTATPRADAARGDKTNFTFHFRTEVSS